jgi:hypothetical protein
LHTLAANVEAGTLFHYLKKMYRKQNTMTSYCMKSDKAANPAAAHVKPSSRTSLTNLAAWRLLLLKTLAFLSFQIDQQTKQTKVSKPFGSSLATRFHC